MKINFYNSLVKYLGLYLIKKIYIFNKFIFSVSNY